MLHEKAVKVYTRVTLLIAVVVVVIITILTHSNHATDSVVQKTTDLHDYCVGQIIAVGNSGSCVSDVQTIVNYIEHSGLTQCPFVGGKELTISSTYDGATSVQVKAVQDWASCYAKQEGFTSDVPQDGVVGKTTWGELCTYGYTDPLRSHTTNAKITIAAGKDAGCAELQSP